MTKWAESSLRWKSAACVRTPSSFLQRQRRPRNAVVARGAHSKVERGEMTSEPAGE